jgi:hypothetical protein
VGQAGLWWLSLLLVLLGGTVLYLFSRLVREQPLA